MCSEIVYSKMFWVKINNSLFDCIHYNCSYSTFNTLRPRQNGHHFADDTFNPIFVNENDRISIEISLKFVPKGPINNIPALVQKMAWRRPGDKPLSEPVMVSLLTHICVTRPQWAKYEARKHLNILSVDALTRQGISSLNDDPELKSYSRQESLYEHYFVYSCTVEQHS